MMCLYLCICMVGGSVMGVFAFVYVHGCMGGGGGRGEELGGAVLWWCVCVWCVGTICSYNKLLV